MFRPTGGTYHVSEGGDAAGVLFSGAQWTGGPESAVWGTAGFTDLPASIGGGTPVVRLYGSAVWGTAPTPTPTNAYIS